MWAGRIFKVQFSKKTADGLLNSKRTDKSEIFSTFTPNQFALTGLLKEGFWIVFMVKTTSSAFKGFSSCQRRFSFRVNS